MTTYQAVLLGVMIGSTVYPLLAMQRKDYTATMVGCTITLVLILLLWCSV